MTITNKTTIQAIRNYKNLKAKIAELESQLDANKAVILEAMGDADTATASVAGMTVTITNKAVTSTRLDSKKVKALYPQIVAECSTTTTAPRFIVK